MFDPAGTIQRLQRKPSGMTRVQLGAWLIELSQLEAHIAAAKAEAAAEFDRLKAYRSSGAISTAAWMSKHTGVTKAAAARQVETATGLAGLPETRDALSAGEIPVANAERLARAKTGDHGDKLDLAVETKLLAAAARSGPEQFSRTVARWERSQSIDSGATEAERRHQKRSAKRFTDRDGLNGLMALFDPIEGAEFFSALNTFVTRRWQGLNPDAGLVAPPATAGTGQLMIGALVDMAKAALANLTQPGVTPRPTMHVIIDHDTLIGKLNDHSVCQMSDGTPISVETARRLGCEAGILPYLFKGSAQMLDMGRRARVATQNQINALLVRDGTCTFDDCNTPGEWCHAHHINWWEHGGGTDLSNLVLVCTKHHHLIHEGGWQVTRRPSDGRIQIINPSGVVVSSHYSTNQQLRRHLMREGPPVNRDWRRSTDLCTETHRIRAKRCTNHGLLLTGGESGAPHVEFVAGGVVLGS